jgi:hypothetical protein
MKGMNSTQIERSGGDGTNTNAWESVRKNFHAIIINFEWKNFLCKRASRSSACVCRIYHAISFVHAASVYRVWNDVRENAYVCWNYRWLPSGAGLLTAKQNTGIKKRREEKTINLTFSIRAESSLLYVLILYYRRVNEIRRGIEEEEKKDEKNNNNKYKCQCRPSFFSTRLFMLKSLFC